MDNERWTRLLDSLPGDARAQINEHFGDVFSGYLRAILEMLTAIDAKQTMITEHLIRHDARYDALERRVAALEELAHDQRRMDRV